MDRNGMIDQKLVDVRLIILGMVTSVKRIYVALEVVNIIRQLINVSLNLLRQMVLKYLPPFKQVSVSGFS